MDVLDHSCSKMGFGGKMCIDGTFKFEEEKDDSYQIKQLSIMQLGNADYLNRQFPEIKQSIFHCLKKEIPV